MIVFSFFAKIIVWVKNKDSDLKKVILFYTKSYVFIWMRKS